MRELLRELRRRRDRLRLRWWALRLDLRLRRNGSRLVLRCAPGARFDSPPIVEVPLAGGGEGSFTLDLGPGASLGRRLVLELWAGAHNELALGQSTWIGDGCRVSLQGGRARIGRESQVRDLVALKVRGRLSVGDRTVLSRGAIIHADQSVSIGSTVALGERVSVLDSEHAVDGSDTPVWDQPVPSAPVTIADNVVVGANSVILSGSRVGANSVLGAGAVVTGGELPAGWLSAGVPARPIRALSPSAGIR